MKTRIFSLIILSLLIISSCGIKTYSTPTASRQTYTPVSPGSSTPVSTPVLTETPSSFPTPTVRPTLSPTESADKIAELMQKRADCSKPCFWGIIPGITTFDDATSYVDLFGSKALTGSKDSSKYYNTILHYKDVVTIGLALLEKNGIVQVVNAGTDGLQNSKITPSDWLAFRPDSILEAYGNPSSIKVILGEGQNGVIIYELLISYEPLSLFVLYQMEDIGHRPNPVLHTCPLAQRGISTFNFSIGQHPNVPKAYVYSIEEITNLSIDKFSNLLIEKGGKACLDFNISSFYK